MEKDYTVKILDKHDFHQVFNLVFELAEETKFYQPNYSAFQMSWSHYLDIDCGIIFGAYIDGELIGIISAIISPDTNTGKMTACEMHWFVKKEHRKIGVGQCLFNNMQQWAKERHCEIILVARPYDKSWMQQEFRKQGFKPLEVFFIKEIN